MARTVEELHEAASALSEEDQITLATLILEGVTPSIDKRIDDAWRAELDRRAEEVTSGRAKTIPWSEVRERLYASLDAKKR